MGGAVSAKATSINEFKNTFINKTTINSLNETISKNISKTTVTSAQKCAQSAISSQNI